jgi:plastocyanin
MHPTTNLFALFTLIATATAASHVVNVGENGFAFTPNSVTAAKGDTVVFYFYPGDHDVVQGDFNTPCSTSGGFYSGFFNPESGVSSETFTITIDNTDPIWIYCSQVTHCQSGMVMAINAP